MPRVVQAVLVKLATDDGYVSFFESRAEVGKTYQVDLDSIVRGQEMIFMDGANGVRHFKDIVYTPEGAWLPLECLKIEP